VVQLPVSELTDDGGWGRVRVEAKLCYICRRTKVFNTRVHTRMCTMQGTLAGSRFRLIASHFQTSRGKHGAWLSEMRVDCVSTVVTPSRTVHATIG
jgi:hypothetical protein